MKKATFYEIFATAHNNALDLLREADLLYKHGHYARAYFCAFTGLEEVSKSQLAADVFTGILSEAAYLEQVNRHDKKIVSVTWITEDMHGGNFDHRTEEFLNLSFPSLAKRSAALYTDVSQGKVVSPSKSITKKEAEGLIHVLMLTLETIFKIEHSGNPIGTKGFVK